SHGQLSITNNLILTGAAVSGTALGGNLAPKTIINAQGTSRIFQVSSGFTVSINNAMLEEGVATGTAGTPAQGGAIFDSGSLTLNNDTVFLNFAVGANGAAGAPGTDGVDATSSTPATAGGPGGNGQPGGDAQGGAIYVSDVAGAALSMVNCVVTNNVARQG